MKLVNLDFFVWQGMNQIELTTVAVEEDTQSFSEHSIRKQGREGKKSGNGSEIIKVNLLSLNRCGMNSLLHGPYRSP
jgi:hypothetical protein